MNNTLTQGERIKAMRRECRFTQEYVADKLGTTKQAIYKYEADIVKNIPLDKLLHLAQLLGCSAAWLQGLSDERGDAPTGDFTPSAHSAPIDDDTLLNPDDHFAFYRDFMDLTLRLTPSQRNSVYQYAQFLLWQHEAAQED